ncbi:hypothetical protein [Halovivax gelatinilyticus]|uniref:hypothetical protein n=1 Tax=Halovivax gelatinilyticus TaxID=2961597 RepID=UPI0020CA5BF0|nr:hypothetical protein [Halovivax gelatinilyticus]
MSDRNNRCGGRKSVTRRSFVNSIAAGGLITGTTVIGNGKANLSEKAPSDEDLHIEGNMLIKTRIAPEKIQIDIRKTSPDLVERYGKAALTESIEYERPYPNKDDLPKRDVVVKRDTWTTRVGTEGEWERYYGETLNGSTAGHDVSPTHYADEVPDYYHNLNDGIWEQSGPINLIGELWSDPDTMADDIVTASEHDNQRRPWGTNWTTSVADATRYLYDPDAGQYRSHDASVASGPAGFTGRTHARIWETPHHDVVMAMAAHEDDWVPHEAVAYLESEYRIAENVDDEYESNMHATKDIIDFGNSGLDHNGKASLIYGHT